MSKTEEKTNERRQEQSHHLSSNTKEKNVTRAVAPPTTGTLLRAVSATQKRRQINVTRAR
jgi:hypothetical protein